MDRDSRDIGRLVQRLREDKGWSQGQLSARMGLENSTYISKLERGLIRKPTFDRLAQIARALGVPDWELTGGAPPPGATDDAFLRALSPTLDSEQVERLAIWFSMLTPENQRSLYRQVQVIVEEQEHTKAELRRAIQRRRREAQDSQPPDPAEDGEPPPDPTNGAMLAGVHK